jgi:siroheme synthase
LAHVPIGQTRATLPDACVVVGTLVDIADLSVKARIEAPAVLIVGEVVSRRVLVAVAVDALAHAATG